MHVFILLIYPLFIDHWLASLGSQTLTISILLEMEQNAANIHRRALKVLQDARRIIPEDLKTKLAYESKGAHTKHWPNHFHIRLHSFPFSYQVIRLLHSSVHAELNHRPNCYRCNTEVCLYLYLHTHSPWLVWSVNLSYPPTELVRQCFWLCL